MTPEVEQEYKRHLIAAVLRHGEMVSPTASYLSWRDHDEHIPGRRSHPRDCPLTATDVRETSWQEFMGTFYEGDDTVHGVEAIGVSCACGRLKDRRVRWTAHPGDVAKAVFEELYTSLHPGSVDDTPA